MEGYTSIMLDHAIVVFVELLAISIAMERSLHFVFYFAAWRDFFANERSLLKIKSIKAFIALALSIWICFEYDLDAYARIIDAGYTSSTPAGYIFTALIIAGGSGGIKFAVKELEDLLKIRSAGAKS